MGHSPPSALSVDDVALLVGATSMQPCGDRELAELFASEQPHLGLELDRHQHHEQECHERRNKVDGQARDGHGQARNESDHEQCRSAPRDAVAALRKRRVLLELLLDLSEDALFVFRQWHIDIIARRTAFLNAVAKVPPGTPLLNTAPSDAHPAETKCMHTADGSDIDLDEA